MAATKMTPGAASERVAGNLKTVRKQRGMSTYDLARKLEAIGWSLRPGALTRIEAGDRRVDVDDLLALAIVLDVSPNRLILPNDYPADAEVADVYVVTPETRAELTDLWQWVTGDAPLVLLDEKGEPIPHERSYRDEVTWAMQNAPHRHREVYEAILRQQHRATRIPEGTDGEG